MLWCGTVRCTPADISAALTRGQRIQTNSLPPIGRSLGKAIEINPPPRRDALHGSSGRKHSVPGSRRQNEEEKEIILALLGSELGGLVGSSRGRAHGRPRGNLCHPGLHRWPRHPRPGARQNEPTQHGTPKDSRTSATSIGLYQGFHQRDESCLAVCPYGFPNHVVATTNWPAGRRAAPFPRPNRLPPLALEAQGRPDGALYPANGIAR